MFPASNTGADLRTLTLPCVRRPVASTGVDKRGRLRVSFPPPPPPLRAAQAFEGAGARGPEETSSDPPAPQGTPVSTFPHLLWDSACAGAGWLGRRSVRVPGEVSDTVRDAHARCKDSNNKRSETRDPELRGAHGGEGRSTRVAPTNCPAGPLVLAVHGAGGTPPVPGRRVAGRVAEKKG